MFARTGLKVFAIEVPDSEYLVHTRFPTILCDGPTIPFDDASFDVVYSSHVLEHIPHVVAFQREIACSFLTERDLAVGDCQVRRKGRRMHRLFTCRPSPLIS